MKNFTIDRTIQAPRAHVWAVLADYPNIVDWNEGVVSSSAIGDATEGVGAQRQCELTGSVAMRETVTEWIAEEKMVVAIDQVEKMPVVEASMTFTLADGGESTPIRMSYDFQAKGGPFAGVIGAVLSRPMSKGFSAFIDDLERAAQARATA